MAGSLAKVMYRAIHTTLCSALQSNAEQLPYPVGDATGQDALDGPAVEPFEDLGTHAKSFKSPEGEEVLSCPLHDCLVLLPTVTTRGQPIRKSRIQLQREVFVPGSFN